MPHEHRRVSIIEVAGETGIGQEILVEFVERQWITPVVRSEDVDRCELDEEDIARARLILELRRDFGVNDEAVPIILHLIDELNAIRRKAMRRAG